MTVERWMEAYSAARITTISVSDRNQYTRITVWQKIDGETHATIFSLMDDHPELDERQCRMAVHDWERSLLQRGLAQPLSLAILSLHVRDRSVEIMPMRITVCDAWKDDRMRITPYDVVLSPSAWRKVKEAWPPHARLPNGSRMWTAPR